MRLWVHRNVSAAAAEQVRIVYGGHVTETNAENLVKLPDLDGFMCGSTSTKPAFRNIFNLVQKHVESEKWTD